MKRLLFLVSGAALCASVAAPARADDAPPPAPQSLSYDDASVHYTAPDGWTRVEVPQGDDAVGALFVKAISRTETRTISLKIKPDDSTLEGLDQSTEIEIRTGGTDVFIDKRRQVTLANGMPAWFISFSSGDDMSRMRFYTYIVTDTKRSVIISYGGRNGMVEENDAKAALASLAVVVYPETRR